MQIYKVVNNNIVIVQDANQEEQVMMGRGIGFGKHAGDEFDEERIEKRFSLNQHAHYNQLIDLLQEIPLVDIEIASQIMDNAMTSLGKKLNESALIALSDHIHTAIERAREDIFVKNVLLWDIKRFYPDEYQIGKQALRVIEQKTGVQLPEDEAGFIALHIANAQLDEQMKDMFALTKVMQEVITIIKYTTNTTFDEDSIYYYRFITHLKFFAQRLLSKKTYEDEDHDNLLSLVKDRYITAYHCVKKVQEFIQKQYDYVLSDEEQLYLTIHIDRIIKKAT